MATVTVNAELPDTLLRDFLQHIRDFEAEHFYDILLRIGVSAPEMKIEEMKEILQSITPGFRYGPEVFPHS